MAKVLEFQINISPPNEYSGLISFRIDWFDLLAVQGTLKSFLQYHSSKASILLHSAFFTATPTKGEERGRGSHPVCLPVQAPGVQARDGEEGMTEDEMVGWHH